MGRAKGAKNFDSGAGVYKPAYISTGRRSRKLAWLAEIETVNREALAEGLSYGRYLARELERESLKRRRGD